MNNKAAEHKKYVHSQDAARLQHRNEGSMPPIDESQQ